MTAGAIPVATVRDGMRTLQMLAETQRMHVYEYLAGIDTIAFIALRPASQGDIWRSALFENETRWIFDLRAMKLVNLSLPVWRSAKFAAGARNNFALGRRVTPGPSFDAWVKAVGA